jgi:hypothetical protein
MITAKQANATTEAARYNRWERHAINQINNEIKFYVRRGINCLIFTEEDDISLSSRIEGYYEKLGYKVDRLEEEKINVFSIDWCFPRA